MQTGASCAAHLADHGAGLVIGAGDAQQHNRRVVQGATLAAGLVIRLRSWQEHVHGSRIREMPGAHGDHSNRACIRLLMGPPDQRPCASCLRHRGVHVTWLQVQVNSAPLHCNRRHAKLKCGPPPSPCQHLSWRRELSGAGGSMDAPAFDEWQVFAATAASRQQTEEPSSSRFVQVNCMALLSCQNTIPACTCT